MCWCLNVYWTIMQNLFIRATDSVVSAYYNGCCHNNFDDETDSVRVEDYVIVKDNSRNASIFLRKDVENEIYFRSVDRMSAEEILTNRVDGSCLVRPYKEMNTCIKYIVSVYAQNNFFHLYIRKIQRINKYGIGLEKPFEKLFNSPEEIINYYRLNRILCTNKSTSISLVLVPIS